MRALSTVAILFSVGCGPAALVVGSRDAGPPDAVAMVEVGADVEPDIHPTPDAKVDTGPPDATAGGCLVPIAALFDQLPYTVTGGDFNGDGNADLVIGDAPVGVQVYLGHGDGTFEKTNSPLLANHPVAVGDLNGDGKLDVVATSELSDSLSVRAFLGDGHGGFQDAVVTPISQVAAGVAIADFDGDSHPDVTVTTGFGPSGASVLVLPGHGDGTFGTEHDYALGQAGPASDSLIASDLNGDGHQDLVFCSANVNTVSVMLGMGNGTFASPKNSGTGADSSPARMAVGDLDGDGKPDVVFSNQSPAGVGVLRNNGDGTFGAPSVVQPLSSGPLVAIGDMDGDGRADLVYAVEDSTSNLVGISFALAEGGFSPPVTTPANLSGSANMALIDINGDHKPDVIVTNHNASAVQIFRNDCGK